MTWSWALRETVGCGAAAGAVIALIVASTRILAVWARATREASHARSSLGQPLATTDLADACDKVVTVCGRVRSVDDQFASAGLIKHATAVSITASARRFRYEHGSDSILDLRGGRLHLQTAAGLVEVSGPLQVLHGSRVWLPAKRVRHIRGMPWGQDGPPVLARELFCVVHSVSDGDQVVVRGLVRPWQSPGDHDGGYRSSPAAKAQWQIQPSSDHQPVMVCSRNMPRLRLPLVALAILPVAILTLLGSGLGAVLWRQHRGAEMQCDKSQKCLTDGSCHAVLDNLLAARFRCEVGSDLDCLRSTQCKEAGFCGPQDGQCVATEKGCARSKSCRASGTCTAAEGRCIAAGSDCENSAVCDKEGACTARDGKCVIGSTADCLRHPFCSQLGLCTYADGKCHIGSDADCARTAECRDLGKCKYDNRGCVAASNQDCERSTQCRKQGYCTLGRASDDSVACVRFGDTYCLQTEPCRNLGLCSPSTPIGDCVAGSDADCRRSAACKFDHRCTSVDNRCVTSLLEEFCGEACRVSGRCTLRGRDCVATTDEQCRKSQNCAQHSWCKVSDGLCVAGQ